MLKSPGIVSKESWYGVKRALLYPHTLATLPMDCMNDSGGWLLQTYLCVCVCGCLGFRVWSEGLGIRVEGLGFRVEG